MDESPESLQTTVTLEEAGQRVDQLLASAYPDWSRSQLQRWIKQGKVTLNGEPCRPKDKIQIGDVVCLQPEDTPEITDFEPQSMPLDVVYEDSGIVVINKPAGLVVHPAPGNWDGTLLNGLLYAFPEVQSVPRAGIVHRLDKETSGLMVVARNLKAHKRLVEALQARIVSRRYRALAQGSFVAGATIDAPIGRHPQDRKRMAVVAGGKEAITHYRIERRFEGYTLLDVKLETGRTHQIRVHLAHIKHPIVGDPVYGGRLRLPRGVSEEVKKAVAAFPRQALHAYKLGLEHPETGEMMRWSAQLPPDMTELLTLLEQDSTVEPE